MFEPQLINSIYLQDEELLDGNHFFEINTNLKNSLALLNYLNESINNVIAQSVLDLVNCAICLSPANEPLACPKCNNFCCKKCFEKYYENKSEKNCPLCKRTIKLSELKESELIKEVENILNKNANITAKISELSKIIKAKKLSLKSQFININSYIQKIFKIHDELQNYKKVFHIFMSDAQKLIETTFQEANKKIENIINSLLSYNNLVSDSMKKYDDVYKKNKNKLNNNDNIKNVINELLYLDRKQLNYNNQLETEEFISTAIKFIPSINIYQVSKINFKKNDFLKTETKNYSGNNYKLNLYNVVYNFTNEKYKCNCELTFTLRNDNNKKMCFLLSQFLIYNNNKKEKLIPMKLLQKEGNKYTYTCNINCDELFTLNEDEVTIKTEALIFTI